MPNTTNKRRFYRGDKASIVWDGRNNRALCDLSKGHFTTSDEYTIKVLKSLGYEQIPLNATEPPPRQAEPIQPLEGEDAKGVPEGISLEGVAKLQEDEYGPEVTPPKSKLDKTATSPPVTVKLEKKVKRSLKRRQSKKKGK